MELAMVATVSVENDLKSVKHAKWLEDWLEWNTSIQKELDLHK